MQIKSPVPATELASTDDNANGGVTKAPTAFPTPVDPVYPPEVPHPDSILSPPPSPKGYLTITAGTDLGVMKAKDLVLEDILELEHHEMYKHDKFVLARDLYRQKWEEGKLHYVPPSPSVHPAIGSKALAGGSPAAVQSAGVTSHALGPSTAHTSSKEAAASKSTAAPPPAVTSAPKPAAAGASNAAAPTAASKPAAPATAAQTRAASNAAQPTTGQSAKEVSTTASTKSKSSATQSSLEAARRRARALKRMVEHPAFEYLGTDVGESKDTPLIVPSSFPSPGTPKHAHQASKSTQATIAASRQSPSPPSGNAKHKEYQPADVYGTDEEDTMPYRTSAYTVVVPSTAIRAPPAAPGTVTSPGLTASSSSATSSPWDITVTSPTPGTASSQATVTDPSLLSPAPFTPKRKRTEPDDGASAEYLIELATRTPPPPSPGSVKRLALIQKALGSLDSESSPLQSQYGPQTYIQASIQRAWERYDEMPTNSQCKATPSSSLASNVAVAGSSPRAGPSSSQTSVPGASQIAHSTSRFLGKFVAKGSDSESE